MLPREDLKWVLLVRLVLSEDTRAVAVLAYTPPQSTHPSEVFAYHQEVVTVQTPEKLVTCETLTVILTM